MGSRLWTIISVLGIVGVLLAGWFLGVSPQLEAAQASEAQRVAADSHNAELEAVVAQLIADEKDLPALKTRLAALQRSIPRGGDTSAFIDDINAVAGSAGVVVTNISFSDAIPYVAPVETVDAGSTPAPEDSATEPATPVDPLVPTAVTNALITGGNFVLIPTVVQSKGTYDQVLSFVDGLQTGSRLYLATGFSSTANADDGSVLVTTTGYIYVLLNQYDPTAAK